MWDYILLYLVLGATTILIGELRGEELLERNKKISDTAVADYKGSKYASMFGQLVGLCIAVLLWPAYAIGMLLMLLEKKPKD